MTHCGSEGCTNPAMLDGYFCNMCFQLEWGESPASWVPLPSCLMSIAIDYCDFSVHDCLNLELFHFVSSFCTHSFAASVFEKELYHHTNDTRLISFFADRFCRSQKFWDALYVSCCNPWDFLFLRSFQSTQRFAKFHPIQMSYRIIDHALWQQTDSMMWWITSHVNNIDISSSWHNYLTTHVAHSIRQWESHRVFQYLIDFGYFSDEEKTLRALMTFAASKRSLHFFTLLWNIHFSHKFIPNYHDRLFEVAVHEQNVPLIDFLGSLTDIRVPPSCLVMLIQKIVYIPDVCAMIIRNKHLVTEDWISPNNIKHIVTSPALFTLYDANVFPLLNSHALTDILLTHDVLRKQCLSKSENFWATLSHMTHLGRQKTFWHLVEAICNKQSLADIRKMVEYPVMQRNLTFAALRDARPAFLYEIITNNQTASIEHLDWFATWRDCKQNALTLADVCAKDNKLFHFAQQTKNDPLVDWILAFERQHQTMT